MDHETLSREITATPAEFARGIVAAFPDAQATPDGWQIAWRGARAEVRLGALPDLTIGLLRLARQTCRITLCGDTAEIRAALLDRLDRYQQRGGG